MIRKKYEASLVGGPNMDDMKPGNVCTSGMLCQSMEHYPQKEMTDRRYLDCIQEHCVLKQLQIYFVAYLCNDLPVLFSAENQNCTFCVMVVSNMTYKESILNKDYVVIKGMEDLFPSHGSRYVRSRLLCQGILFSRAQWIQ